MSTRSGKRIHNSFHEHTVPAEPEVAAKSERKTRTKRVKQNLEEHNVSLFKNKKRINYVTYPTDDELHECTATINDDKTKCTRVLRKDALKEQNVVEIFDSLETQTDAKNLIRKSRRGKRLPDDAEETENVENVPVDITELPKPKKNKKTKKVISVIDNPPHAQEAPAKKSKKKKKKGKKTSSMIVEDVQANISSKSPNKSNMSIDSFHSAAGSPDHQHDNIDINEANTTFERNKTEEINQSSSKTNRKSSANSNFDKNYVPIFKNVSENADDININIIEKRNKKRKSVLKDTTFDNSNVSLTKGNIENDNLNTLYNGQLNKRKSSVNNTTFDKDLEGSNVPYKARLRRSNIKENNDDSLEVDKTKNNDTFEKSLKKKSSLVKDASFDNNNGTKEMSEDTDTEMNVSNKQLKTRKSSVNGNMFDSSNAAITKDTLKVGQVDINEPRMTRQSSLKDATFDKSNASMTIVNSSGTEVEQHLNVSNISNKQLRRRRSSVKDTTCDKPVQVINTTFEKDTENKKNSTFDKSNSNNLNANYDKDVQISSTGKLTPRKGKKSSVNTTYENAEKCNDTFEKDTSSTFDAFKKGAMTRKSSIIDTTFDKNNTSIASLSKETFEQDNKLVSSSGKIRKSMRRHTFDKSDIITENGNISYDEIENEPKQKSSRLSCSTSHIQNKLNTTFEKETEKDNENCESKSFLFSSDNSSVIDKSEISRISITSDDTSENIVNTTPVLIESSMDESNISASKPKSPKPQTPLKREGTFTKEGPEVQTAVETKTETPKKEPLELPSAGCTPFHITKSSQKKSMLNVTRSIEKGRPSVEPAPRMTRVMFCSPVDNPLMATQEKRKIIKSNLKGSNKSFIFDETAATSRAARKRSYTQSDAEDARAKRSRLTAELQQSVERLARPRTASATGKLSVVTPSKKPITPSKPRSENKVPRTKLPNFAVLHQKQFDKMESLDECQERRAKRAKQLMTPTAPPGLLERISPKNNIDSPKPTQEVKLKEKTDTPTKTKEAARSREKTDTPTKKLPTLESLRPGFTRFGFKLNLDVNPFSIPSKKEKPKVKVIEKPNEIPPRQGILPSLAGATSVRREVAKQAVMREKSFTEKRNVNRNENRTIIKGVRTNRRFELQMKMRNID